MKVLITGSMGYVGSVLGRHLRSASLNEHRADGERAFDIAQLSSFRVI